MSFMIKIAFVLQATVAATVGLGTSTATSTSAPAPTTSESTEQAIPDPVLNRATCDVCYEIYDNCLQEGISAAGCTRLAANCFKNCL